MKRVKIVSFIILIVLAFSLCACDINRRIEENYSSYTLADPSEKNILGKGEIEYKTILTSDYASVEIPSDAKLVKEYSYPKFEYINKDDVIATIVRDDGSFNNITSPRSGFLVEDITQAGNFLTLAYGSLPEDNIESRLRVKITVDQNTLLKISVGQDVAVSFEFTNDIAYGKIVSIGIAAGEDKTYPVYIELNESVEKKNLPEDNDDYLNTDEFLQNLKIGMSVVVKDIESIAIPQGTFKVSVDYIIYSPNNKTNVVKDAYLSSVYCEDIYPTSAVTLTEAQYNQIKKYLVSVDVVADAETGFVYIKSPNLKIGDNIIYYEEN